MKKISIMSKAQSFKASLKATKKGYGYRLDPTPGAPQDAMIPRGKRVA